MATVCNPQAFFGALEMTSVSGEIEIRKGLNVGDTLVISDMRDFKDADRVLISN